MEKNISRILFSIYLFLIFNFISINVGYSEDVNSYNYLKLEIQNTIKFNMNFQSKYNIEEFKVESYFLPSTYNGSQYLNEFQTNHKDYNIINKTNDLFLTFNYNQDTLKSENEIVNNFIVESTRFEPEIKKKVDYPLRDIDDNYKEYLEFNGLIDINDDIRDKASSLASGLDDTYLISAKIAKWIREDVNYDLSTATNNPNQRSTDVFKSKSGVCKEISNLFISMMRSIGIPARVVTGYAYTTNQDVVDYVGSNWGGHAWTEVLIGDEWVPFDLTYNQYGYVDSTHIILDKSAHIRNSSIYVNSYGYGYSFDGKASSDNTFNIIDKKNLNAPSKFDITLEGPKELGFASYGYIKVNVKNLEDNYNILFLSLSKVEEVELLDSSKQMTIFKPNEEKEIYYRYKLTGDLNHKYKYTFPFKIYNQEIEKDFEVQVQYDFFEIKQIALPENEVEKNNLSDYNLNFDCNYILSSPDNIILCSVHNPNNFEINNIMLCLEDKKDTCQRIDLKLNEQKSVNFYTRNYEENLHYVYQDENNKIKLELKRPKMNLTYNFSNQSLNVKYNIENYVKSLDFNIYKNNTLVDTVKQKNSSLVIPLDYGINNIKLELVLMNKTFYIKEFELDLEEPEISFWDKIKDWFYKLFS